MTGMPELVAMLHSFVGAAAVLVGFNSFFTQPGVAGGADSFHMGEVGLAVFIGAVTLTGSIVAYLKLSAKISGKPLTIPGRNAINLAMVLASIALIAWFIGTTDQREVCIVAQSAFFSGILDDSISIVIISVKIMISRAYIYLAFIYMTNIGNSLNKFI